MINTYLPQASIQSRAGQEIAESLAARRPVIERHIAESEAAGRLSDEIVKVLKDCGVFRMPMSVALGGPELCITDQALIIEQLSAIYGAAGWCAMIGSDGGYYTAGMPDDVVTDLYKSLDYVTAGWIVPSGKLTACDGGYVLDGQWQFGSGCTHADIIVGGALVYENGAPLLAADGRPEYRVAMATADKFGIVPDSWNTMGLRGSGSRSYFAQQVFVPAEHCFRFRDLAQPVRPGTLYQWPGMFFANLPAVALGMASEALQVARETLLEKRSAPSGSRAVNESGVRSAMASALTAHYSSRSFYYSSLASLWQCLADGEKPGAELRAQLLLSYNHAIRASFEMASILMDAVGSQSIHHHLVLERIFRDLKTACQHLMGQLKMVELAGAMWLDPELDLSGHPLAAEGLV